MLDGMTIAFLGKTIAHNILICAVERGKEIFIPSGDFQMKKGDIISFVSSRRSAKDFLETIGFKTNRVKSTMIIGGGKAAYYLAKQLLHMGISVKIIEIDKARCEELSILLPKAVIINGDGTNEDLLKEEGIEYTESFVALTGIDEENILLTLYARQVSDAKVITKINRITFKDVISNLDLGSVIYPRYITSETIIAYVRAKKNSMGSDIETLYHMFDHRAEAIEFRVREKSRRHQHLAGGAAAQEKSAACLHQPRWQDHHPQRSGLHPRGRHGHDRHHPHRLQRYFGHFGNFEVKCDEQSNDPIHPGLCPLHTGAAVAAALSGRADLSGNGGLSLPGGGRLRRPVGISDDPKKARGHCLSPQGGLHCHRFKLDCDELVRLPALLDQR